ncbi:plasmid pRiA4b ORF-3 family protein [Pseudactinotalea suaedae]|uniref:plasmid pRiA4b ORF-3 family protein n=1 Tax=Pseudactinotalea suaedae TaxID=1524924 RepID=UPI0012E2C1A6|nr:plasmid pRiA4b ORF-3 family protein [Pseudactinotalea suaedae]
MTWLRVRVDLEDASPAIWRELLLPTELPLPELHQVLQAAMGWQNSHLHSFARSGQTHWTSRPRWVMDIPDEGIDEYRGELPETEATLGTLLEHPGDQATYLYDFGDDWEHLLTALESPDGGASAVADLTSPVLTDGAGVCPPEDVGGIPGYDELLEHVAALERGEPLEEWPEQVVRWAFGTLDVPEIRAALTFDLAEYQAQVATVGQPQPAVHPVLAEILSELPGVGPGSLRRMVQAAALGSDAPLTVEDADRLTENLRWFLDLVGHEGLALTSAGYLRPAVVQQVSQQLRLDREWIGSMNREDQTPGVAHFRGLAGSLGLIRKTKGRLLMTKVGATLRADSVRLLAHIADRMPIGRDDFGRQASLLVVLDLLGGQSSRSATMARCAAILHARGWRAGREPVSEWHVLESTRQTIAFLERCGCLREGPRGHRWSPTIAGTGFLRRVLRGESIPL